MLTGTGFLTVLHHHRTDQIVVTTMSTVRPWGSLSDSPLDFASADSAMGHAADLALGIAIARPDRRVICINGDGSMLMTLGTLATIVESGVDNLILFVMCNRAYEITGRQPVPGAAHVDFPALARAVGFAQTGQCQTVEDCTTLIPKILEAGGPTLMAVHVEVGNEGPISRGPHEQARYLKESLADAGRKLRNALAGI